MQYMTGIERIDIFTRYDIDLSIPKSIEWEHLFKLCLLIRTYVRKMEKNSFQLFFAKGNKPKF